MDQSLDENVLAHCIIESDTGQLTPDEAAVVYLFDADEDNVLTAECGNVFAIDIPEGEFVEDLSDAKFEYLNAYGELQEQMSSWDDPLGWYRFGLENL